MSEFSNVGRTLRLQGCSYGFNSSVWHSSIRYPLSAIRYPLSAIRYPHLKRQDLYVFGKIEGT